MLEHITPLIITFNEEPNLARTLAGLRWARRIVIVDSGSTDGTRAIAAGHPAVEIVERRFDTFAAQCNFGLQQIRTPWVLSLDADYVVPPDMVTEIGTLAPEAGIGGYRAGFTYCIDGRPLRAALYPPRTVLYRVAGARYEDVGHSHRVRVEGGVQSLRARILHDDRKPLARWLDSQRRYAAREAEFLVHGDPAGFSRNDRLRRTGWIAPLLALPYTLVVKRCALDGWPGWIYALQRTYAETLIAMELLDRRRGGRPDDTPPRGEETRR